MKASHRLQPEQVIEAEVGNARAFMQQVGRRSRERPMTSVASAVAQCVSISATETPP